MMITSTNPAMLNINCICMSLLYCIVPLAALISTPSCPCRSWIASTPSVQKTLNTVQPWLSSCHQQPFLLVGSEDAGRSELHPMTCVTCSHTYTHTHTHTRTHMQTHTRYYTHRSHVHTYVRFQSTHAHLHCYFCSHVCE